MTVMELGALGEFVGSIAVIATLIYLALQIRQNTSQQKREETVSIQHGQNTVVALMQDPAVVRAYVKAADGDTPASVLMFEYLCNMMEIRVPRPLFVGLPLKLPDSDGAPVRAIAIEEDGG